MNILHEIRAHAQQHPAREAIRCGDRVMTYGELWEYSGRLAAWLDKTCRGRKDPVAVYGHKNPWMLVCFLGCVRSGRAYCPIDCSVPTARVEMILQALPSEVVLTTEPLEAAAGQKQVTELAQLCVIARAQNPDAWENAAQDPDARENAAQSSVVPGNAAQSFAVPEDAAQSSGVRECAGRSAEDESSRWVSGEETFYIIFTSGSTGTPKGVQISADCLNHYLDWSVGLGSSAGEKRGQVFLNQAPFSFDLSVMDLYTCLASGGTLYCLEKAVQSDYRLLMQALETSGAAVWVSTPSFAEVCLSEKSFSAERMSQLEVFLFCGETLGNRTVQRLQERFPKAKIVNTYGPTESTVAVTGVLVTPKLAGSVEPLPVGAAKPGTVIEIWDESGHVLPAGEKGEIIILGDTVSTGYYGQPELTARKFFTVGGASAADAGCGGYEEFCELAPECGVHGAADESMSVRNGLRGYHTGDKGYLENGMLFYCGRIDLQVKLHGYRIELEDIENNIRRLPGVEHVVVLPNERDGKVKSLTAYVVESELPADQRAEAAELKKGLLAFVPDYMVPKKFVFLAQMPMTNNGKADRKRLAAELGRGGGNGR